MKTIALALCVLTLLPNQGRAQNKPASAGYLAVYFDKTEGAADSPEKLHYALSHDGFHFTSLNGAKPVLASTLGDKKMRDPMILRDQRGVFHLVVTNSWDKRPFTIWDSPDLIHWRNERLIFPSDPDLHPTWAPELGHDDKTGLYFVSWTGVAGDWGKTAYLRYMTTTNFKTWSAPKTLYQKIRNEQNVPVMDGDIFQAEGRYHLVYRANDQIWEVTSSGGALGPYTVDDHLVFNINGEGPFVYQLNGKRQWNLAWDYFGGNQGKWGVATSTDARTWKPVTSPDAPYYQNGAASFPEGVRHGYVLSLTAAEYKDLERAFPSAPTP